MTFYDTNLKAEQGQVWWPVVGTKSLLKLFKSLPVNYTVAFYNHTQPKHYKDF